MMDSVPTTNAALPAKPRKRGLHNWTAVTGAMLEIRNNELARRGRRIVALVAALWVLNIFDLVLTILAHSLGNFTELNPLARQILDCPASLSVFKLTLVSLSTVILLSYRHIRLTEIACWGLCGIYSALAFIWMLYFETILF